MESHIHPLNHAVKRVPQRSDDEIVNRLRSQTDGKLKLAIVYSVLYRFRMPIFRRITSEEALDVKIFTSTGVLGSKLENAKDLSGVNTQTMWTFLRQVKSSSRSVPLIVNPTLFLHLFKFRPDVLLIQGGMVPNNFLTLIYAKLTRTPIIWWSLGRVKGRQFKGISAIYQKLNKWIESKATCYAGYSSESVNYFIEQGYPPENCFNLVNVVDTDLVQTQINDTKALVNPLREKLGLQGKKVILFVGSVTKSKGLDTLVRAFAQCQQLHEDTVLLVVGDGPELENIRELTRELQLDSLVVFTGSVYEGVAAYFQLGSLMVLPGTGGLAISEAMTHGLPIICSIGDGVEHDLIDNGVNGYIVNPGDVEQLSKTIVKTVKSDLKEMGNASREIIEKRSNITTYMKEMLSAISYATEQNKL